MAPLPEPAPPEVIVIHAALLAAFQVVEADGVTTEMDPVAPAAPTSVEVGLTINGAANCIRKTPSPNVVAYRFPLAHANPVKRYGTLFSRRFVQWPPRSEDRYKPLRVDAAKTPGYQ